MIRKIPRGQEKSLFVDSMDLKNPKLLWLLGQLDAPRTQNFEIQVP
jgi:hypothetical protein